MGLKDSAIKGVAWTSVGTLSGGFFTVLVNILMARMLTPADFGLMEIILVFSFLSDVIVDSGFSQAIIRDSEVNNNALSSVFFLNITIAFIIYTILFSISPSIAKYYNSPELSNLARFTFLSILCNSFLVVPNAYQNRQLNFKPFAIATLFSTLIAGIISCTLAYRGIGIWALAINFVLTYFLRTLIVFFQTKWRPKFTFRFSYIKKYYNFGVKLLLMGLLDKFVTNIESLLIGKYYTKADLGYFSQGRKIDSYVIQLFMRIINTVSYPTLSKLKKDNNNLKIGYQTVLKITICGITPVIACLISCSENIIICFLGEKWVPSAIYLRIWTFCGYLVTIYSFFTNTFLVKGKSGQLLIVSCIRQSARLIAIILLIRISIIATMYGIVAVTIFSFILYVYFGGKQINYKITEFLNDIIPFVISGISVGLMAWLINNSLSVQSTFLRLIIQVVILFVSYIIILLSLKNKTLKSIIDILKNKHFAHEKN